MTTRAGQVTPRAPWEQAVRNNQLLSRALVAALVVVVGQAVAIASLFPLKEKTVEVVEYRTGAENFVVVHRAGADITANQALLERELASYVMDRESVDKITEQDRYARVVRMSGEAVGTYFREVYGAQSALYFQAGKKRSVHITRKASLGPGIYQIEFSTRDVTELPRKGETPEAVVNEWVATMAYDFEDQRVSYDERELNPMGLVVTEYTITRRQK